MSGYYRVADILSETGTCQRRNVAAVVVVADSIRSSGVNVPSDASKPLCVEGGCPRGLLSKEECPPGSGYAATGCTYIHAERVALGRFREVERIREAVGWANGLTVYVSSEPCVDCQEYARWACANLLWEGQNE